jgi:hypothetical protein
MRPIRLGAGGRSPILEFLSTRSGKNSIDPNWAAQPIALQRRDGRTMLLLEDPGGEPLDRFVGQPMDLTLFLRFAVALGKLHQRGLM